MSKKNRKRKNKTEDAVAPDVDNSVTPAADGTSTDKCEDDGPPASKDLPIPEAAADAAIDIQTRDYESDLDEGISFASGRRINTTDFSPIGVSEPAGTANPESTPPRSAKSGYESKPQEDTSGPDGPKNRISLLPVIALTGFFVLAAIGMTGWFVLQYQNKQIKLAAAEELAARRALQAATPQKAIPKQPAMPAAARNDKQPAPAGTKAGTQKPAAAKQPSDRADKSTAPAMAESETAAASQKNRRPEGNKKPGIKKPPANKKTVNKKTDFRKRTGTDKKVARQKKTPRKTKEKPSPKKAARQKAVTLDWNKGLDDLDLAPGKEPEPQKAQKPVEAEPVLNWDE